MKIERDSAGDFFINQRKYIEDVIETAGVVNAKDSKLPLDIGYYKLEHSKAFEDKELYQKIIGQLLYISVNTRPDIAATVSILGRKVSAPSETDWTELKRCVKYLKGTITLKLRCSFSKSLEGLKGYCDADWAEDNKDRKSNSGYLFTYNGGTISWCSRKQNCVALSTAEAEYVSMTEASKEVLWIVSLLRDFGEVVELPVKISEDNQSALKMLDNEKYSNRTKHMDIKFHFVKHHVMNGNIMFHYCPTEDMTADLLTKPLQGTRIMKLRKLAGLI